MAALLLAAVLGGRHPWRKNSAGSSGSMARPGLERRLCGIVAPLSLSPNLSGSRIHPAMCALCAARLFSFGIPAVFLTVLLGVDALVGPVRASVNVQGHCAAPPLHSAAVL
jgi:Na+/H+-dicarboxylate symporter